MFKKKLALILSLIVLVLIMATGCGGGSEQNAEEQEGSNTNTANEEKSCMTCHSDYEYLLSQAETFKSPLGAEVTAEQKAKGLLVENTFMQSTHGNQSCESCHNGNPEATTVEDAHSGDFVVDPTADGGSICGSCHKEQYEGFDKSLHFTLSGIKNKFIERLGTTPDKEQAVDTIMKKDCLLCHATCGTCHVGTPDGAATGLQAGHNFVGKPDNLQVCTPCHHLAGPKYFTEEKDLHVSKGMDCVSCHKESQEFHGRGQEEEHMMTGIIKASCNECHNGVETSNTAHQQHMDTVSCWACHTDEYESCTACHSRQPEEEHTFKLGQLNGKIYPFIQSVANADMFKHLGFEFDQEVLDSSRPTWHAYTPHFINKSPIHKEGATVTCDNCHGNPDIFLQEKDLVLPELEKQFLVTKIPKSLK